MGRHHGAQQPALEGHLGRLGEPGQAEQGHGHQQGGGRAGGHDLLDVGGAGDLVDADHAGDKGHAAQGVHPQGPQRVLDGQFGAVMADQQEGAQGGDLEEEVEPDDVIGKRQPVHGPQEGQQQEEKAWLAGVGQLLVGFVAQHVGQGEHTDQRSHDGDYQGDDKRKVVAVEAGRRSFVIDQKEFEEHQGQGLQGHQDHDEFMAVPAGDLEHDAQQGKVGQGDGRIDQAAPGGGRGIVEGAVAQQHQGPRGQYGARDQHGKRAHKGHPHAETDRPGDQGDSDAHEEQQGGHGVPFVIVFGSSVAI